MLHPLRGGGKQYAGTELMELEAPAVADAFGVDDVPVVAEGGDGYGVRHLLDIVAAAEERLNICPGCVARYHGDEVLP